MPEAFARSFCGGAKLGLEFGEDEFDGIEVGRVRRQEAKGGAASGDGFSDLGAFVARQVVHDDEVAGPQFRDQELADVVGEDLAVHRPVDDERSDQAGGRQPGDEGGRLPMSVRRVALDPLATGAAAIPAPQVGGGAGLVEEDQAMGGEPVLVGLPALPQGGDVRPKLLTGVNAFF